MLLTDAHLGALPGRARPGPTTDLQGDQGRALLRVGLAADAHDPHLHRHDEPRGVRLQHPRAVARVDVSSVPARSSSARCTRASGSERPSGRSSLPVAGGPAGGRSPSAPPGSPFSALGIAVIGGVPAAVVLLFTAGVSFTTWVANGQSLLQLAAPDQLRGRVVSIYIFVFAGFMPVSAVAEGWLADVLGTRFAFASAGIAGLLAEQDTHFVACERSIPAAGAGRWRHRTPFRCRCRARRKTMAGVDAHLVQMEHHRHGDSARPAQDNRHRPRRRPVQLRCLASVAASSPVASLLMMLAGFPAHGQTGTSLAAIVDHGHGRGNALCDMEGEGELRARSPRRDIPQSGGVLVGTALQQRIRARPHLCLRSPARRSSGSGCCSVTVPRLRPVLAPRTRARSSRRSPPESRRESTAQGCSASAAASSSCPRPSTALGLGRPLRRGDLRSSPWDPRRCW